MTRFTELKTQSENIGTVQGSLVSFLSVITGHRYVKVIFRYQFNKFTFGVIIASYP
jgi:hypothetical protein